MNARQARNQRRAAQRATVATSRNSTVPAAPYGKRKVKGAWRVNEWHTTSPYYKTPATIDSRWSQTVTNRSV